MKILLCAIAKLENNYIKEWVEYHKNLGFDNIVLYDNNDKNGETFDAVLHDYISSGFVIIKNVRGEKNAQVKSYKDCYNKYKSHYDWIAYWDIDEFIQLENNASIKDFLSEQRFVEFDCIRLCWKQYTDNNLIDVVDNDYSVVSRFTEVFSKDYCIQHNIPIQNYIISNTQTKSIIRTNINDFNINSPHVFLNVPTCNAMGEIVCNNRVNISGLPVWKGAWINHYRFKTVSEYIRSKMNRGWPTTYMGGGKNYLNIKFFLKFNVLTPEKKNYIITHIPISDNIQVNSFVKLSTHSGKILPNNWGDELNFNFLSKLFDKEISLYDGRLCQNYAFIGSIISNDYINDETIIWGSGIQEEKELIVAPKKVCAVRGPLTRNYLIKHNIDCPEIYGDPALLLPEVYNPKIDKKYKLGIVPHWQSKLDKSYHITNNKDVIIINLKNYNNWTDVIDLILSCEYIASESLHGLIVAEAYNIPNLWIDINLNGKYDIKFHDFFLSMNSDRKRAYKVNKFTSIENIFNQLKFYKKGILPDLEKLKQSCPITIKTIKLCNKDK